MTDKAALSALITSIAQSEQLALGQGVTDAIASVIVAGNTALDHVVQTDQSGAQSLSDTASIELVEQGPASTAIQQAANNAARIQGVLGAFTGGSLSALIAAAGSQLGLDDDIDEQSALRLTVSGRSLTPISASSARNVPFTLAGLDLEDSGIVTFSDAKGKAVQVAVNGGQTSYHADLSRLADGPITSTLAVNDDPAGNSFTPVNGNTVTLDQDLNGPEAPVLSISNHSINVPAGGSVALPVKVLADADDNVQVTISGVPSFESITANDGHQPVAHRGANYTFTAGDVNAGLTLHSTYSGSGHPVNIFTLTAANLTPGEAATSAAQTIKVTDPPASSSPLYIPDAFTAALGSGGGSFSSSTGPTNSAQLGPTWDQQLLALGSDHGSDRL